MINNLVLKKAGHILMLILWIESISRMLIGLKQDPKLLRDFQKTKDVNDMLKKWWELNKDYGYEKVMTEFKRLFSKYPEAHELLEKFWLIRDLLSHAQVSADEMFFCNINERSRSKKKEIIKKFIGSYLSDGDALSIRFNNREYEELLGELEKFDKKFFPQICSDLGIQYFAIRWPMEK